jgi:predicted HTH transcriptional regulator
LIAREIISNSLVHREYASVFPAKIVIEKDRIFAENWNKSLKEKNGTINAQTAAELIGKPAASVRRYLKNFVDAGLLTSSGANKNRAYQLVKK